MSNVTKISPVNSMMSSCEHAETPQVLCGSRSCVWAGARAGGLDGGSMGRRLKTTVRVRGECEQTEHEGGSRRGSYARTRARAREPTEADGEPGRRSAAAWG
jgi:hypothetical protein